ncbi:glucose dehydrogenase [Caerostris darwini]|uniref:Glucose dehydrogenase n=1 Tax=Caerostris darwini TaxID=1538125 RepID=A0AAV4QWX0_9ARAC|nr:glucose dehydrogenase [Caerostris darwini]
MDAINLAYERSFPTPFANSPLLPLLLLTLTRQRIAPKTKTTFKEEYDYVIVGAGAGGSVVASRLSEECCVSVLLLEAGKAGPQLSDIPGIARYFVNSELDWKYKTEPQKYTGSAHINRQALWSSGKGLGGSSLFNGLIFSRGNPKNYDDWAAQGASGWSFREVWPYFLKQASNWDLDFVANGYHSVGGPATVQRPRYDSEIKEPVLEAARRFGYRYGDPNGARQTGFADMQGTMGDGQRCNDAEDYLVPAENRTNLDILTNAFVTKIIMEGNQAVGVQFDREGTPCVVKARREVIVSAGVTNTPKLLMLSGIGPREHLEKFGIPVVADLPVGNNLQDHPLSSLGFKVDPRIPTITQKLQDPRNIKEFIANRIGPLTSMEFISAYAFLNTKSDFPVVDFPDYQMKFVEFPKEFTKTQFNLKPEVYKQVFESCSDSPVYICCVSPLQPKSRGTVRLRSSNPYDPPAIDPNYFEDQRDLQVQVEGLKNCNRFVRSEPMKKVGAKPLDIKFPGDEQCGGDEDCYLENMVKSFYLVYPQGVGTCKMGDPRDDTTVVDPSLRVKGIKGLRVVDASVMPIIPSGNPHTPAIMVAEKASDIIKETINCPLKAFKKNVINP